MKEEMNWSRQPAAQLLRRVHDILRKQQHMYSSILEQHYDKHNRRSQRVIDEGAAMGYHQ